MTYTVHMCVSLVGKGLNKVNGSTLMWSKFQLGLNPCQGYVSNASQ